MSAMSVGGAVDEAIDGHPSTRRTDIWRSPRLVLEVLTSIARDGLQCLRRAGLPILTISLFAFVLHGWLVDRSARLAIDNGDEDTPTALVVSASPTGRARARAGGGRRPGRACRQPPW